MIDAWPRSAGLEIVRNLNVFILQAENLDTVDPGSLEFVRSLNAFILQAETLDVFILQAWDLVDILMFYPAG